MAYIGRQLVRGQNRVLDDISSSFNGSTTAFNLTVSSSSSPPASVNQLWIIIGGILQKPGTDFTVADAVITFTTAPASTLSFWGMIQGDTSDINSPADASVTPSKIANSGDFAFPADVRFKDADASHYVGLQAPSTVSSNLVWTLPAADGSANQVLKTDGSGALGWATDSALTLVDEDNMSSNSASSVPSQQSVKAYVDAGDLSLIDEDNMSTDSATRPPSQQSVKAYADTKAVLTGSTNNTITTVTGANAIQGEANLTYDGDNLSIAINASAEGLRINAAGAHYPEIRLNSNRTGAGDSVGYILGQWNSTDVCAINLISGSDTTNKDDGEIDFYTRPSGGSMTNRMRIDSSGQVGIGSTSPASQLELKNNNTGTPVGTTTTMSVNNTLTFTDTDTTATSDQCVGSINFKSSDSDGAGVNSAIGGTQSNTAYGQLDFNTGKVGGSGNAAVQRRVRIDHNGLNLLTGNVIVANGSGIDFSATSDGTVGAAELLSDYEEGEFTPAYDAPDQSGTTFSQYHQYGYYTRIGNVVTVSVYIQGHCNSNAGSGTDDHVKVTGLPFAPAQIPSGGNNRHQANWAIGSTYKMEVDDLEAYTYGGQTYIALMVPSNGGTGTTLKSNQIDQNTTQFNATATYRI